MNLHMIKEVSKLERPEIIRIVTDQSGGCKMTRTLDHSLRSMRARRFGRDWRAMRKPRLYRYRGAMALLKGSLPRSLQGGI